jgi:putative ABC transport system ATP-binding protein
MSKPVIQIKNLEKVYEGAVPVHAVNGINLTITEGEFTALKGPSGCGKTTLLNLLGGLDKPTSGSIEIGGVDITTLSENQLIDFRLRNIGFVFQAYNLIPVLSAQENVSFIMLLQDRPKEEREARAQQLLEAVGLKGKKGNGRDNYLGDNSSAWPWPERSHPNPNSFWQTNPPRTWTRPVRPTSWTLWRSST